VSSHRIVVSHFHIFSIIHLFSWNFTAVSARINLSGPPHLPAPSVATGACIQCSGYPKEAFKRVLSFGSKTPSSLPASAAIRHATAPVSMAQAPVSNSHPMAQAASPAPVSTAQAPVSNFRPTAQAASPHAQVLRRCPAEAFIANWSSVILEPVISGPPLISIGPHTDAVLDRFKLGDETLLKLCILISTIHSSWWEENLRSPRWDLNYEQASKLN